MELSTHKVEVVPVELELHPNADTLSIVKVFGYTAVVKTEQWKDHRVGAYIPPDSVVPDSPEYAFLNGHFRIKARRYGGVMSQGLLMPVPLGDFQVGDDVAEVMGVTHYVPPEEMETGGDAIGRVQLKAVSSAYLADSKDPAKKRKKDLAVVTNSQ